MSQDKLLQDRRVLVTGGSRGLGRALCVALAEAGARVAFSYQRNDDAAADTLTRIQAAGRDGMSFKTSVLDVPATADMVGRIEAAWGGVDILVNNAGITQSMPLALIDEQDFARVLDVNVKGTFITSKAVLRGMIRRKGGVILNIGSLAGVRMLPAPVHYCASKAAITGMTQSMAKEVARHGIRVLCLAPGILEDGVGMNVPEHRLEDYLKHCALRRLGTFDEVARFVCFLVSGQNTYMTGATLVMDGGV